jgi:hypothetical protein
MSGICATEEVEILGRRSENKILASVWKHENIVE